MQIKECPIIGQWVTLEPLSHAHVPELIAAVCDGEYWKLTYANVPHPDDMAAYVEDALGAQGTSSMAYAVRLNSNRSVVGTTRYYNIDTKNKRAMIGYTWYANAVRRTPVNTECKYLLLKSLFEDYQAIAAEFRTHINNETSRNAITRLGAKQDGILRNHMIMKDGSLRDTVVYSIIDSEWADIKQSLQKKLP